MANIPIYGKLVNETTEGIIADASQVSMPGGGTAANAINNAVPFYAEYGETTLTDILTAYHAGRPCFCRFVPENTEYTLIAPLSTIRPDFVVFCLNDTTPPEEIDPKVPYLYSVMCNSDGWSLEYSWLLQPYIPAIVDLPAGSNPSQSDLQSIFAAVEQAYSYGLQVMLRAPAVNNIRMLYVLDAFTDTRINNNGVVSFSFRSISDSNPSVNISYVALSKERINNSVTYALTYPILPLQRQVLRRTVTLASNAWSNGTQTVTVAEVKADETAQLIQPVPASASRSAYEAAGVKATAQAANSLTFSCDTTPESNLTVYVIITEVSA